MTLTLTLTIFLTAISIIIHNGRKMLGDVLVLVTDVRCGIKETTTTSIGVNGQYRQCRATMTVNGGYVLRIDIGTTLLQ